MAEEQDAMKAEEEAGAESQGAGAEVAVDEAETPVAMEGESQKEVHPAEFAELEQGEGASGAGKIDIVLDVSVPISVVLGRAKMSIKELLRLGVGSVVGLDRIAGEPARDTGPVAAANAAGGDDGGVAAESGDGSHRIRPA